MSLKRSIEEAMKAAMRAGDKPRLGTIRLIMAAIKQVEVDSREALDNDDAQVLAILDKMVKQRRESIAQYQKAGRDELAAQEANEIEVIQEFLPEALSEAEIDAMIEAVIAETSATSIKEMGKVMGLLKPKMQGRTDIGAVSARIKARLTA